MANQMFTTLDREHPDGGWLRAEFGLHQLGRQAPYCSLTGTHVSRKDSRSDRDILSCGQLRDDVLRVFPELQPFARFHLATDGIPMHYLADAKFWHDMANGVGGIKPRPGQDPREIFVTHCIPLDADDRQLLTELLDLQWHGAETVLVAREEKLRQAFQTQITDQLDTIAKAVGVLPQDAPPPPDPLYAGLRATVREGAAEQRDGMPQNWLVTLHRKGRQLTVPVYGGGAVAEPDAQTVLDHVLGDAQAYENARSLEDFCNEFGYDTDSREGARAFHACREMSARVRKFLGDDFDAFTEGR